MGVFDVELLEVFVAWIGGCREEGDNAEIGDVECTASGIVVKRVDYILARSWNRRVNQGFSQIGGELG